MILSVACLTSVRCCLALLCVNIKSISIKINEWPHFVKKLCTRLDVRCLAISNYVGNFRYFKY